MKRARPRAAWPPSPSWTPATRLWVVTIASLSAAVVWWQVREFTTIVVLAVLLAYILNPLIERTQRRLRLPRAAAALLVYAALAVILVLMALGSAPGLLGTMARTDFLTVLNKALDDLVGVLPASVTIFDREIEFAGQYRAITDDFRRAASELFERQTIVWLLGYATDFAFTVLGLAVTFVASLYVAMDGPGVMRWFDGLVPAPYRAVYRALQHEIDLVWRQFFRGQLILAAVVGALTTIGLVILGVPFALALGVVAGVLEVVPRLGPVLATLPAMAVALVSTSLTFADLDGVWFALAVGILYVLVQQVENNILVPRILGDSVNLRPAVVLVGALAGAKLAGIVGIILAAPVLGSLRVIGAWLHYQVTRMDGHGEIAPSGADADADANTAGRAAT